MKVWTIANQKGGVGKTTTTVALGGLLASWGFRTLMIDIDPHGSLTSYFRYDPDSLEDSSYSLFQSIAGGMPLEPHKVIYKTGIEGLGLIPAAVALATLDRQSGRIEGLGLTLKQAVGLLKEDYDYVLIDCPPILGVLLINALAACDKLLIPVQTDFLAIKGLERMSHTLKMISRARHRPLEYLIIPTLFDRRTRSSKESLNVLQANHGEHLWNGVIPMDTKFKEASRAGLPPTLFAAKSRGAGAYGQLLESLLGIPSVSGPHESHDSQEQKEPRQRELTG